MHLVQNIKLTDDKKDEKYQRERTQKVKDLNKSFDSLKTTAPAFIKDRDSKKLYKYLSEQLNNSGYINNTDQSILVTLVINLQALKSAYESLNSVGATYTTDNGMIKQNPACQVISNATTKILSASSALGFSPASRASLISLAEVNSEDSASKIMDILGDNDE